MKTKAMQTKQRKITIPSNYKPGPWDEGTAFDVRYFSDGRDTYPDDFKGYVEVRDRRTKEVTRYKATGKFIGNFSPIWIRFPLPYHIEKPDAAHLQNTDSIQLTEILRLKRKRVRFEYAHPLGELLKGEGDIVLANPTKSPYSDHPGVHNYLLIVEEDGNEHETWEWNTAPITK